MTKFLNNIYKYFVWIIIAISMVAYLAYYVLDFEGNIEKTVLDWRTWVHTLFVIWLQVMVLSGAYDSGVSTGINSDEFELADKLNNKIITSVNNEMEDFRKFVKKLNEHELQNIREDYLFKIGDKKIEELTKKERKKYNKLKAIRHDIYGFNLPLYYELSKNGTVKYQASIKKNQGKFMKQFKKIFTGILFAGMTINVAFSVGKLGSALTSLLVISSGLIMTFLSTFFPQLYKFKVELPKKVILKKTLYDSYVDFKNGTHVLKKLELGEAKEPVKQQVLEQLTTEDKPIINNANRDNLLTEPIQQHNNSFIKNRPLEQI